MAQQSVLDIIFNLVKKGDGAKQVTKELQGVEQGSSKLTGVQKALTAATLATGLALVGLTVKFIKQIPALAELGDRYNRAQLALEAYSGSAGAAALATDRVILATGGAIDKFTATQTATRFFAMGLATSADEASRLTDIAITLGAAVGKDAKGAVEEFGLLLANTSIQRLDTFGLSAAKVRQRMAELQKETSGLDRQTAFLTATLELAEEKMTALDEAGFEAVSNWDRLRAEAENYKLALAELISDGIDPYLDKVFEATDRNREQADQIFRTSGSFDEYKEKMQEAHLVGGFFTDGIGFTNEELFNQAKASEQAAEANVELASTYYTLAISSEDAKEQLGELHTLLSINLTADLEKTQGRIADIKDNMADWRKEIDKVRASDMGADEKAERIDNLNEKIAEGTEQIAELEEAWDLQTKKMLFNLAEQQLALDGFTQAELDALTRLAGPEGFGLIDQAGVAVIQRLQGMNSELNASGNVDAFISGMNQTQTAMKNAGQSADGLAGKIRALPSSKTITITTVQKSIQETTRIINTRNNVLPATSYYAQSGRFGRGFQHGGSFEVGGLPGPDRNLAMIPVSQGERVSVTPRGAPETSQQAGGKQVQIGTVNLGSRLDLDMFAAVLESIQ